MTRLPAHLRARTVTADGSTWDERLTFADVQEEAARRGFTVERGTPQRGHGMRSGYIVWAFGLWHRCGTLSEAMDHMERKGYDYKKLREARNG